MKRGEIWTADLGSFRPIEQTGARPVVVWQGDALNRRLQSVLVVPLTANVSRAGLARTAVVRADPRGPVHDSVALAYQMRAVPKACLVRRLRALSDQEMEELDLATDEVLGRVEP